MSPNLPCPRCGATTASESAGPGGLCPACLMKSGLESRTGAPDVVFTETGAPPRPPAPGIAELAPHFPELDILASIGRGGTGTVYRARQKSLERDVALKILTAAADAGFSERFQREARTLAGLSHPGIVSVIDYGQRGPWSFLLMEFVDGANLRQMLRARELGPREALSIVTQTCDALQYAHDHGVVHRDIKPENILVTRDGRVKVLDFGLAKLVRGEGRDNLTREPQVMGTPHYMAPEQWERPQSVDHRADIYALGVVFYELLTGELPIGRFAPPSQKVTLDVRLDDVVLRTLEKEPDRRYQHAGDVKDAVTGIGATPVGSVPVGSMPAGAHAALSPSRSSRHKVLVGVAIGCAALLLFVAVPAVVVLGLFLPARRDAAMVAAEELTNRLAQPAHDAPLARESASQDFFAPLDGSAESRAIQETPAAPPESPLEQRARDLGLLETDTSLALSPVAAVQLGIDEARLSKLNAAWRRVYSAYVGLENRQLSSGPLTPNRVDVAFRAAPRALAAIVMDAYDAIDDALIGVDKAAETVGVLRFHVDRLLRFGREDERWSITRNGEEFVVTPLAFDGSGPLAGRPQRIYRVPLPSWILRAWLRDHPFGPDLPLPR